MSNKQGLPEADEAAAPKRTHFVDLSPLRESPAFARLWFGNAISGIGGQMTIVAVGLQIYHLTGSTFDVALVGGIALLPMVVAGCTAGCSRTPTTGGSSCSSRPASRGHRPSRW
ncbi:MAG: hypothetical protein WDM88_04430 [Galbitalea sp.]